MSDSQRWMAFAWFLFVVWLVWLLTPILTPFAIAALFAYIGDPITDWLQRRGLGRSLAVVVVFVVIAVIVSTVILILVPLLDDQVGRFVASLPAFVDWVRTSAEPLLVRLQAMGIEVPEPGEIVAVLKTHIREAGGIAATLLESLTRSSMVLLGWLMNLFLIPVVTFYLLRDWDALLDRLRELLPRSAELTVVRLARESNTVLGAFLRGQLSVMFALAIIYALGLWLVAGLELGVLIGMLAGLISFVPYLGTGVGVVLALIGTLFQHGDGLHVILVLAVFAVGQVLEGTVLTPLLVGDRIGLHPVAVIFAVLAGGQLFGFLGILLALPAASVIMVLLRHAHDRYLGSQLYEGGRGTTGVPPP